MRDGRPTWRHRNTESDEKKDARRPHGSRSSKRRASAICRGFLCSSAVGCPTCAKVAQAEGRSCAGCAGAGTRAQGQAQGQAEAEAQGQAEARAQATSAGDWHTALPPFGRRFGGRGPARAFPSCRRARSVNPSGTRRQRYFSALGSAREVSACLHVADALGYAPVDAGLQRRLGAVVGVLVRVTR